MTPSIDMMSEILVPLIFWLAIFLALFISVIGVLKEKYGLVILGAVLIFPMVYYLSGSPSLQGYPWLLPILQLASAMAVKKKNKVWAWLLLTPSIAAAVWFIGAVLYYHFS